MIPQRVNIIGNHLRHSETDIRFKLTAGGRTRAARIELPDEIVLFLITVFSILRMAGTLIQNPPYIDGRMIVMGFYHFPDAILALFFKIGIAHILFRQSPCMILFPYKETCLIAEIQKQFIVGIMGGSHRIGAHILHQH